jgi:hypothetical protein
MNSNESLNSPVENVETVEKSLFQRVIQENFLSKSSTKFSSSDVESVEGCNLAPYFSTLSTKLKSSFVENSMQEKSLIVSDLDRFPRIPHFPREQKGQLMEIFEWLHIALNEGHIEPSQPCVGRILGWPQSSRHQRTLWSDFTLWCRKRELKQTQIADSHLFFSIVDRIFERVNDRYAFPSLDVCQLKYLDLRREYESFAACK